MGPLGCPEHPIWRPRRRLGRLQGEIEAVGIGRRSMRHLPFFAWFSPARMYLCVGRLVHTRYTPTVHLSAHLPCTAPPKQRGAPVKIPEIVYWVSPNKLFQPSTSIFLLSPGALWSWPRGPQGVGLIFALGELGPGAPRGWVLFLLWANWALGPQGAGLKIGRAHV